MLILHRNWSLISDEIIERIFVYELLGVLIYINLKWDNHFDSICSKAYCLR